MDCDIAAPVHAVAVFRPGVKLDLAHPTVPTLTQDSLRDYILGLPPASSLISTAELEPLFAPPPPVRSLRVPLLSQ